MGPFPASFRTFQTILHNIIEDFKRIRTRVFRVKGEARWPVDPRHDPYGDIFSRPFWNIFLGKIGSFLLAKINKKYYQNGLA